MWRVGVLDNVGRHESERSHHTQLRLHPSRSLVTRVTTLATQEHIWPSRAQSPTNSLC